MSRCWPQGQVGSRCRCWLQARWLQGQARMVSSKLLSAAPVVLVSKKLLAAAPVVVVFSPVVLAAAPEELGLGGVLAAVAGAGR